MMLLPVSKRAKRVSFYAPDLIFLKHILQGHPKRLNLSKLPITSEGSKIDFYIFQKPVQFVWNCSKNIYLFEYFSGAIHGCFESSTVLFCHVHPRVLAIDPDWSCRKFEDRKKPYFPQKFQAKCFLYTGAYQNFANIQGNINVRPNIIGVKPIYPKTLEDVNYTLSLTDRKTDRGARLTCVPDDPWQSAKFSAAFRIITTDENFS